MQQVQEMQASVFPGWILLFIPGCYRVHRASRAIASFFLKFTECTIAQKPYLLWAARELGVWAGIESTEFEIVGTISFCQMLSSCQCCTRMVIVCGWLAPEQYRLDTVWLNYRIGRLDTGNTASSMPVLPRRWRQNFRFILDRRSPRKAGEMCSGDLTYSEYTSTSMDR